MHAVVMDSLEEYLAGALEPSKRRAIETHLSACRSCREEVGSMQESALLFDSLRSEEVVDLPPGFCAAVLQNVQSLKPAPTCRTQPSRLRARPYGARRRSRAYSAEATEAEPAQELSRITSWPAPRPRSRIRWSRT